MRNNNTNTHKISLQTSPIVSIILLDWSCRERFQALEWLNNQDVSRDKYELIWIELYDRVVPKALEQADTVITCGQKGTYHKHLGYNIGLLHAKGKLITVCDSDAVFPPNFIKSILNSFQISTENIFKSLVLMHYQWRTSAVYPDGMTDLNEINKYSWEELWPNVGACMTVKKSDAIRFGGFDEHSSYKGYICGPYDLGWRMINAGIPEIWHDEKIALWHFSHPDPPATYKQKFSWKLWRESTHPHIDYHALTAVRAFSEGRLLPLLENSLIFKLRMKKRNIGTMYEQKYATMTGQRGFTQMQLLLLHAKFFREPFLQFMNLRYYLIWLLGTRRYERLRDWYRSTKV